MTKMENFKKLFLAGVGAVSLSKDRAQRVVKELIEQGKIREQEGRKLVEEMMKKAAEKRKDVEQTIGAQVSQAYQKVNLATQEQLKKMEKRIHELERELAKQNPQAGKTAKKKTGKRK
jgi:polyhydroxyalkanoate synthesis regulator phasin